MSAKNVGDAPAVARKAVDPTTSSKPSVGSAKAAEKSLDHPGATLTRMAVDPTMAPKKVADHVKTSKPLVGPPTRESGNHAKAPNKSRGVGMRMEPGAPGTDPPSSLSTGASIGPAGAVNARQRRGEAPTSMPSSTGQNKKEPSAKREAGSPGKKAVIIGTGLEACGALAPALSRHNFRLVFVDECPERINAFQEFPNYSVTEVDDNATKDFTVQDYKAYLHPPNATQAEVTYELLTADLLVVTVPSPSTARYVSTIIAAIVEREGPPLRVINCVKAIDCGSGLQHLIRSLLMLHYRSDFGSRWLYSGAVVDRRMEWAGPNALSVRCESYMEFCIEQTPSIPIRVPNTLANCVLNLDYHARRIATVADVALVATTFFAHDANLQYVAEALTRHEIRNWVREILTDSCEALRTEYNISGVDLNRYRNEQINRLGNKTLALNTHLRDDPITWIRNTLLFTVNFILKTPVTTDSIWRAVRMGLRFHNAERVPLGGKLDFLMTRLTPMVAATVICGDLFYPAAPDATVYTRLVQMIKWVQAEIGGREVEP